MSRPNEKRNLIITLTIGGLLPILIVTSMVIYAKQKMARQPQEATE